MREKNKVPLQKHPEPSGAVEKIKRTRRPSGSIAVLVGIFVEIQTMQSSSDLSPRVVEVTDNVTETLSTEDSVEMGARELIDLRFASLNAIDEDVDTDTFVYGANPEKLTNSGANDDAEFEEHDEGEARVGMEGGDWMWNPFRKLAGGGFDLSLEKAEKRELRNQEAKNPSTKFWLERQIWGS